MRDYRKQIRRMFNGQKPEFPLVDMGGRVASLCAPVYFKLKEHIGFGSDQTNETITMLNTIGNFDERVLEHFNVGFRRVYVEPPSTFQKIVKEDGSFADEWGIIYEKTGHYFERMGHPLASSTIEDLESFCWPDTDDEGRYAGIEERAKKLFDSTKYIVVAGHISAGIFQDCWNLRGMSQFLLDMAMDPKFAHRLLKKVTDFHLGIWKNVLERIGEYIDIVETADDLGTQTGLLISPQMYKDMIKPYHKQLNQFIKSKTKARVFFHSCGAVFPLIDDFVEAGVDILNPIQPIPGQLEAEQLSEKYKGKLIFHGGLDVQSTLISSNEKEVEKQIHQYYKTLGCENYIMAPANSIQLGSKMANITTAYQTANQFEH